MAARQRDPGGEEQQRLGAMASETASTVLLLGAGSRGLDRRIWFRVVWVVSCGVEIVSQRARACAVWATVVRKIGRKTNRDQWTSLGSMH